MPLLSIDVGFERVAQVLPKIRARGADLAPAMARLAPVLRFGAGGFAQQIASRTFEDLAGGYHPWIEQSFTGGAFPPAAQQREQVLWDAALGGPGSITRFDARSAVIGVDDFVVRQISAALGNGIVSNDPYFGPVTGNWGERLTPILVFPSKPTLRSRAAAIVSRKRQARAAEDDRAARIFIGLTYGRWFTLERFLQGIELPPKPVGVSARAFGAVKEIVANWIVFGEPVPGTVRRAA